MFHDCNGCKHLKEEQLDKWLDHYYCNKFGEYVGNSRFDLDYDENEIITRKSEQIEDDCYED